MKPFLAILLCLASASILLAAAQPQSEQSPPPLDPNNMDKSVKPGDDFFQYANGTWIKRTEIPPEYSRWGAFNELIERNNDALHTIAEKASQTPVDPKLVAGIRKLYEDHGAFFIEMPNHSEYPRDDFADTFYHLQEETAVEHTAMLAEYLRPLVNGAKPKADEKGKTGTVRP